MSKYLYHGSITDGIAKILATSKLHNSPKCRVVYLTDSLPYSLFYIWDANQNIKHEKHITSWVKNGIVYYEEQFPKQLHEFYNGVDGYIYKVEKSINFQRVENRESVWYCTNDVTACETKYIPDVYEEIMKYKTEGKIMVIPFEKVSKERIALLYANITERIIREELLNKPNNENSLFYQTYFISAWEAAIEKHNKNGEL